MKLKKTKINRKSPYVYGLEDLLFLVNTTQSDLQFQCNPYQNPNDVFCRNEKFILQIIWNFICDQIAKTTMKMYKAGGFTFPNFKTYYKATIIKTVKYWHKNRHINQWNKINRPEINTCMSGQMLF